MDTITSLAAVATLLAAVGAMLLSGTLWRGLSRHRRIARGTPEEEEFRVEALKDPRSCFQVALGSLDEALTSGVDDEGPTRSATQIVSLLQESPLLVFSEVVDDRTLAKIEISTSALCVWIVSLDESIEFEYPDPHVSFSAVVFKNLSRGVQYRYLVIDTPATRDRAKRVGELVTEQGFGDRFQVRFLPPGYWEKFAGSPKEVVVFEQKSSAGMFYLFPGSDTTRKGRKWIRTPSADAEARVKDLQATWELAALAVDPTYSGA